MRGSWIVAWIGCSMSSMDPGTPATTAQTGLAEVVETGSPEEPCPLDVAYCQIWERLRPDNGLADEVGLRKVDDQDRLVYERLEVPSEFVLTTITTWDEAEGRRTVDRLWERFAPPSVIRERVVDLLQNGAVMSHTGDVGDDGVIEAELVTRVFSEDGDPTEQFVTGFEERDEVVRWTYDEQRRPLLEERDVADNAVVDLRRTFRYDDEARLATIETDGRGSGTIADGTLDFVTVIERDIERRIVREEIDDLVSGARVSLERTTWEDGRIHQVQRWTGTQPAPQLRTYTYDAQGRLETLDDFTGTIRTYTVVDCP